MDLDGCVAAHQKWKIRLGMIIEGNSSDALDPLALEKDDLCNLGKWLQGAGAVHCDKPEYDPLMAEHAAFHRLAAGVLHKALQGDRNGAKADLDGPYNLQSQKVVAAILNLKKAIQ